MNANPIVAAPVSNMVSISGTWLDSLRIGHHRLHRFDLKICKAGGGDCGAHEVCTSVKDAINCNKE